MVTVEIVLDKSQFVEVTLVDVLGQSVSDIHNGSMSVGKQQLQFSCESLADGAYFIQIDIQETSVTKKIIINH